MGTRSIIPSVYVYSLANSSWHTTGDVEDERGEFECARLHTERDSSCILGLFDPRSNTELANLRSEAQKDIVRGAKVEGQLQDEGARNNKRDGRCVRKRNKSRDR